MRLDPNDPPERVEFNGIIFRRMGGKRRYYLSQGRSNAARRGAKGLHVAVWEHFSGQMVPKGYEINHIDRDTFNCSFENLECLPMRVHRSLPKNIDMVKQGAHLERIRPLASAWHKSEAGRAWHKIHATASLGAARIAKANTPPRSGGVCVWCGGGFTFKNIRKVYCSSPCRAAGKDFKAGKRKTASAYYLARLQSDG